MRGPIAAAECLEAFAGYGSPTSENRAQDVTKPDAGRRRRRRDRSRRPASDTSKYRKLINPFEPLRVLAEADIGLIHESALRLLANEGVRVLLPEARRYFSDGGASVDDETMMVRLDPDAVRAAVGSAPGEFSITARNPGRSVVMGGRNLAFANVGGPPHVHDIDSGKRNGTIEDYRNLTRMAQHFDVIHLMSPAVEPLDVEMNNRHLNVIHSQLTDTDKVPFIYARGTDQVTDGLSMVRIANGLSEEDLRQGQYVYTVINTNSPRQLDVPMCLGLIQFAANNQVSVITPFTLAGAMAPITLAGALTLQHAEALAGITLTQIVRQGAPVVYGAFTSNVNMRSGAPAFGTPEAVKAAIGSGQLARHVGLPWRSSGVNTSNAADAQGGYETMFNTMGAIMGGANLIIHAAGWMESGLTASYEKFILDAEMLQIWAESFLPIKVDADEIGMDALAEVQPGGHFFGVAHTMERYETAFYETIVFSRENWGQWTEGGSLTATQRANQVWKNILANFEPPPMDEAIRQELDEFVARRTIEGGAPPES